MAVKLDVLINYIFDNAKLKRNISSINNMMTKGTISPRSAGGASFDMIRAMVAQGQGWQKHYSDIFKNIKSSINKLNVGGFFKDYIKEEANVSGRRINLNKEEVENLTKKLTEKQLDAEMQMIEDEAKAEEVAWEENRKFDKQKQIQERRNQEAEARKIMGEEKWNKKMNILHSKALEENKKRDEALRKKQWMLMLGKWGKFGVWGIAAQQAIKYISRAIGFTYSTSMQGLDWQRTISGGASGGSWFGKDIAAYQRAGIGASQLQGFKRGIQGYLGQVKLGMGNAAPLMYLGLSALGNPDEFEKQVERGLRRIKDKTVSQALAQTMGLDYTMWEAIYSGRLDRERSAYSEKAIQEWSNLATSLNDLITNLKTFFFNNLAPIVGGFSKFVGFINKGSSWATTLNTANLATSLISPTPAGLGSLLGQVIKFGAVEVIVKNENGEVIEKKEVDVMFEMGSGEKR